MAWGLRKMEVTLEDKATGETLRLEQGPDGKVSCEEKSGKSKTKPTSTQHPAKPATPPKAETKTAGGIVLPDSAKDKPQRGEVLAVGEGHVKSNGTKAALTHSASIVGSDDVFDAALRRAVRRGRALHRGPRSR